MHMPISGYGEAYFTFLSCCLFQLFSPTSAYGEDYPNTPQVNEGYTYKVSERTCIEEIPKSIKMPSTPNFSSSNSLSTDLTSLKFLKTVIALTPPFKTASRRGWAMSCATESTSIPTKYFNS